jgi:IS1 family transposase
MRRRIGEKKQTPGVEGFLPRYRRARWRPAGRHGMRRQRRKNIEYQPGLLKAPDVPVFFTDHRECRGEPVPGGMPVQTKAETRGIERNNSRQRRRRGRFRRKTRIVSRSKDTADLPIALFAKFHVHNRIETFSPAVS